MRKGKRKGKPERKRKGNGKRERKGRDAGQGEGPSKEQKVRPTHALLHDACSVRGILPDRPEHEKLLAYDKALDVAALLDALAQGIPDRRGDLKDQLRRASASVPLNLAEGAAEFSSAEKARFYRLSRRSAAECSAILDLLDRLGRADPGRESARKALAEVASMLTAMVKAVESRKK